MTLEHTAIWGKALVDELKKHGFSPAQISGNSGIRLSVLDAADPKLSFELLAMLFERAAELTGDDLVGFRHGQNTNYRRGGLIAYTGLSSPTVRTLLNNLSRYQRISSDAIEIDTSKLEDGITAWHFKSPRSVSRRQYVEFGATGIVDVLRRLSGRQLNPRQVEFRHLRASGSEPMRQFFGCPIKFGAQENRVILKIGDLDLPLRTADDYLYQLMIKYCEEAIAKTSATKSPLVFSVEEEIARL